MSYAKRMSQLPTSRRQHLAALALVAALAFSLGLATAPLGRRIARLTGSVAPPQPAAVVVPGTTKPTRWGGGARTGDGTGALRGRLGALRQRLGGRPGG